MDSKPFYLDDPWLDPFKGTIKKRFDNALAKEKELAVNGSLEKFALGHLFYGLHADGDGWVFREWAPNAVEIHIIGEFSEWKEKGGYKLRSIGRGDWEVVLPKKALKHGDLYKLLVKWKTGLGERLPSYANRVVQDETTKIFSAQVWAPPTPYLWTYNEFETDEKAPLIYEAHVGMATEECRTGTYKEFSSNVIPRIAVAGYNTIQLMAVQEHPFYGSFGYHVANYFAASSRFGTPEELKELIDNGHKHGLRVIMDLVHSHSVKNVDEGLGLFDGAEGQYFHTGTRRIHKAWDSLCFDYGKDKVLHFLLSNCRFWLDEYKFDGFRFDGITSMVHKDHGLEKDFTKYDEYFDGGQDEDAITYLVLANKLIHSIKPSALTIAEEMSGFPGTAAPTSRMGLGFDYRLSMGVPDYWIKNVKEVPDENWEMGKLAYELTQHRVEEKTVSYCESHDQALVGDQTLIFRMLGAEIYTGMEKGSHTLKVDRGIALHKMIRLITFASSGGGYLNFMGNEFGHPEWIDFPRAGNNWSFQYARRQWSLVDNPNLKYRQLALFDKAMTSLQGQHKILDDPAATRIYESESDKVIAFSRGGLLFVFNFHPTKSFTDYGIPVQGKYKVLFDSDQAEFGGFGRIDKTVTYLSQRRGERITVNTPLKLYLYLPSRTATVFRKEAAISVFDV